MTVTLSRAKSVCNAKELALVRMSLPNHAAKLSAARLREKIALVRTQRDKWRDLSKTQRRTGQAKKKTRGAAPGADNTALKATIFDETLARYQAALEKAESSGAAPAKKKSKKKTASKPSRSRAKRDAIHDSKTKDTPKPRKKSTKRTALKKQAAAASPAGKKKASKKKATKKTAKKTTKKAAAKSVLNKALAGHGAVSSGKRRSKATLLKKNRTLPSDTALIRSDAESQGPRKARRYKAAGSTRVSGHVGSRTRRNQAKRDSR